MKPIPTDAHTLNYLSIALHPSHYLGILQAALFLELRSPEPIHEDMVRLLGERQNFIDAQWSDDRPTGLIPEPVFWTDLEPAETTDLDELLALAPVCQPFLLCSSVAPHARWAAKLHMEDNEPVYFPTKEAAQRECDDAMEEGRRERARLIEEAFAACAVGDIEKVAALLDDANFDVSINHGARTLTIDGRTEPFGPPPPAEAQSDRPDDGA